MDGLHSLCSCLHCGQSLSVDIGRFDGVDLLLQCNDLRVRVFERRLVVLSTKQGLSCHYPTEPSIKHSDRVTAMAP